MKEKQKKSFIKKIFSKKFIILAIVIAIIFFAAKNYFFKSDKDAETATVAKGTVKEELILSGFINATEYAKLTFQTNGKISWLGVKEGDLVKKGQSLAKLDTVSLNAAYQQSLSTLRAAEATVANVHDQVKDHSGDETFAQKDTRTTAEVTKDRAYEAMLIAQDNLRSATLFAPFGGIVTYVAGNYPGMLALATQPQFEIINPKTLYFDVTADQTEVVDVSVGQKVAIVLDSLSDDEIQGTVAFISYTPRTDETSTSYKIKVELRDDVSNIQKFKVGMGGDAKIVLNEKTDVLYLPSKFVKSDTTGKYVKTNTKNGKKYIEVGIEGEDETEVKGDISEGLVVYD